MLVQAEGGRNGRGADYDAGAALARLARDRGPGSVVIGQLGQSLDGRICTPTGASKHISGDEALRHLHRLRAAVDAVVIGVGTALADDPRLTTRRVRGRNPVRVVIDPNGRAPEGLALLRDAAAPVVWVTRPGASAPRGAEGLALDCEAGGLIPPAAIVTALAERGLRRVLVEGGADTLARFIDAGALDELHLMVAPIVLGSGKTGLNLAPIETVDQALRPRVRTMRFADGDLLCLCEMTRAGAALAAEEAWGATR